MKVLKHVFITQKSDFKKIILVLDFILSIELS